MPNTNRSVILTENLFENVVAAMNAARDKDGNSLKMDSVIVSQGNNVVSHFFTDESNKIDLRSLSKPTLCLALGIALTNGLQLRGETLSLDTLIWPFFEDRIALSNSQNRERLGQIRLRHLLTHTMGYEKGLMFSKDVQTRAPDTLLEYIFNTELIHEPGRYFVYSNVGPYIISALIQEELGVSLSTWVDELLFQPLGITNFTWKNYGKYCAASSGLKLTNHDLHKIARLMLDDGQYRGKQIVPADWIKQMRSTQVETPGMCDETRVFPKFAYGFYLWICRNGNYYCDGTDGQYLIVLPENDIVITTLGHQSDMKPITTCFRPLLLG